MIDNEMVIERLNDLISIIYDSATEACLEDLIPDITDAVFELLRIFGIFNSYVTVEDDKIEVRLLKEEN